MDHDLPENGERRSPRVTPVQVIALALVAASIGWAAWLLRDRPTSEEVELLPGTVLPSSELAIVAAAFDRAQLAGHRTEGGRVWVPRSRQSAYMRALVDAEALPREFGSSLRRALERNSPWQSRTTQEELLRVAIQEELAHVICSMPGIERAAVLYDVDERSFDGTLGGSPTRTASVNVRTQLDTELEPMRIQAIRVLVAASIAGLTPERVAVTDLRSGRVHAGPLAAEPPADPVAADPDLARRIAYERHLAAKLRQGLSFVKGIVVDVTVAVAPSVPVVVDEPSVSAAQQRVADANSPAEVTIASPKREPVAVPKASSEAGETILVSVAVPESWFDTALAASAHRDGAMSAADVHHREEERLRQHVLQLLPPGTAAGDRQVVITRFPVASSVHDTADGAGGISPSATPAPHVTSAASNDKTPGWYVDTTIAALVAGKPQDVPREAWMAIVVVSSAMLTLVAFRGGRARSDDRPLPRRTSAAGARDRIDWTSLEDDPDSKASHRAAA